jgi:hypothetical protein
MATAHDAGIPPALDQRLAQVVAHADDVVVLLRRRHGDGDVAARCLALARLARLATSELDRVALASAAEGAQRDTRAALHGVSEWAVNASEDSTPRALAADELAVHAQAVGLARALLEAAVVS